MSDRPVASAAAQPEPANAAAICVSMVNAAIAGQLQMMASQMQPFPVTDVINLLIEHVGQLLSLVEVEQIRNQILGEIRQNLPAVVTRHVAARMTTPGGVILPGVGDRVN